MINLKVLHSIVRQIVEHNLVVALEEVFAVECEVVYLFAIHIDVAIALDLGSRQLAHKGVEHRAVGHVEGTGIIHECVATIGELNLGARNHHSVQVHLFIYVALGEFLQVKVGHLEAAVACHALNLVVLTVGSIALTLCLYDVFFGLSLHLKARIIVVLPYLEVYMIVSALCGFIVALLPLLLVVRSFKSEPKPMRTGIIAMLTGIWIVAMTLGFIMFVMMGIQMQKQNREYDRLENTHNGIYMDRNNWELTSQNGWNIEVAKNFGETIYGWSDEDPLCMEKNPIRIRADKSNQPIEFAMSRKEAKEEGDYVLECLSSCSVVDATLSVWNEGKCLSILRLDGYGSASNIPLKGLLWEESRKIPLLCQQNDSTTWVDNVLHNDANWRYLSTAPFHHKGGIIEYRLRIGQHDVKDIVTNGGYVKMVHEGLRKQ
jgi:hypothetical protein